MPAGVAGAITDSGGVDGLATGMDSQARTSSVHWTDAGVAKSRRGLVVATANTNEITFEVAPAGEGDSLPAETRRLSFQSRSKLLPVLMRTLSKSSL